MSKVKRTAVGAAAVFVSVLSFFGPAVAHEESALHALSVLKRVSPDLHGISFRVVQITQPVLVARNRTREPLVILGPDDEPFLRLWRGRVETNLRSRLTYMSTDPTGRHAVVPRDVRPDRPPRWRLVARRRSWSWFDPRIRFATAQAHDWVVQARLGDERIAITGTFEPIEGHGHFRTSLDQIPQRDDLEVRLLDGLVPALFIRNDTGKLLEVRGRHGEPFLRIGPRGVSGNDRSPDYWLGGTNTVREVPASADPAAPPRWIRLSTIPLWSWLEFRARLPVDLHQRALLGSERKTVLRWSTPMTLGAEQLSVAGHVDWIPPRSPPTDERTDLRGYLGAGLATVLVVAAAWFLRRRLRLAA